MMSSNTGRKASARSAASRWFASDVAFMPPFHPPRLGACQTLLRPDGNHAPLVLGEARVDVQQERVDSGPEVAAYEGINRTIVCAEILAGIARML
jgi:hypothetical protein